MDRKTQLLDRWGKPVRRAVLRDEVAAPTITGVRSPMTGTPADGLNPVRLANILRAADHGDPVQYLELAEIIEERDPHYLAVLSTRKRSVGQIEITVEAASTDKRDIDMAEMVREWLKRDELTEEIFDILDCIGKGYSFTEIIWDTSEGQWRPARLEWRDPRWFRFDRTNLTTPMMLDENGQEVDLDPFKFIYARIKAKSGLALRAGLARVATWGWMFKAFTQRDWAIFTQTYGQPLRVGKWAPGASEEDKNTLFNAVANIAGDCAAIMPESMTIDFIESKNVGSAHQLYKERSDWLDQQISKAVLGQTGTTDSVTGGLGSGKEHREVQEDLERADARALSAILNRDLIRPWIDLEYGPQKLYPRLVIARPEKEDLNALTNALAATVPLGLRVKAREVRERFALSEPKDGDEILGITPTSPPDAQGADADGAQNAHQSAVKYPLKGRNGIFRTTRALQAQTPPAGGAPEEEPEDVLAAQLSKVAGPAVGDMIETIEAMLHAAGSLDEFSEMLRGIFPNIDIENLTRIMTDAIAAAEAAGRALVEEDRG
jgi:phage gp29-like protein